MDEIIKIATDVMVRLINGEKVVGNITVNSEFIFRKSFEI